MSATLSLPLQRCRVLHAGGACGFYNPDSCHRVDGHHVVAQAPANKEEEGCSPPHAGDGGGTLSFMTDSVRSMEELSPALFP